MARVVAIDRGHDGSVIREVGDVFDVPDERLNDGSTWFVAEKLAPKPVTSNPDVVPGAGPRRNTRPKVTPD